MKLNRFFSQTRRETPADLVSRGAQLLVQAGYLQWLTTGGIGWLPLGFSCLSSLEHSLLQLINDLDPHKIALPQLPPPARSAFAGQGFEGARTFSTRALESFTAQINELARSQVRSYRQLPVALANRSTLWRDLPSQAGLLRSRQDEVLVIHALETNVEAAEKHHQGMLERFLHFMQDLGVPLTGLEDLPPSEGGSAWQGLWLSPDGDQAGLACDSCGYQASLAASRFTRIPLAERPLPLERVATPDCPTIESLAEFLGIPASCTAKAVLLTARTLNPGQNPLEETVFVVVRGDRAVNETALLDLLGAHELLPANDAQVRALGAVPGYASPIGLPPQAVIVDTEIPISPNLVSGANLHGFHLRNVNCGRDYQPGRVADIALAQPGDPCPNCRAPLASLMGWELVRSHITSGPAATTFMDDNGKPAILQVASWQFYLSRMLGALAEVNQDSSGLCLPLSVAACPVHLVILPGKEGGAALEADLLQEKLLRSGIQVVVDDRPESPGVKFNDADLIGLPLRLTLSERSLRQGGVEIKPRRAEHPTVVPLEGIVEAVREFLAGQEGAGTELGSQDAQSGKQSPGGGKINATGEREHAHFT